MNTQVDSASNVPHSHDSPDIQLPAGAGLALAVLLGSVLWMGIFALIM
ncbi:MAG: hypothetical protein KDK01_14850 [Rhodobacteraceae bacterium]|jgi:hypothetical protein|nr:hypothetical protein [Paracoccaceae bacterium]